MEFESCLNELQHWTSANLCHILGGKLERCTRRVAPMSPLRVPTWATSPSSSRHSQVTPWMSPPVDPQRAHQRSHNGQMILYMIYQTSPSSNNQKVKVGQISWRPLTMHTNVKRKTPWISCSRTPEKSRCSGSIHCQAAACTTTDAFTRRRRRRCSIWSSSWVVGSSVDDQLYCEEGNWVGVLGAANVFWALLIPILYNYSWWCFAYSLLVWCACRHPHLPPILISVSRVGSTVSPKSWSPQSMVVISCYVNGKACEN